jgi:TetR/AcrR family transcriptional regulator, fatty acid metabolism regulator protein
MQKLTSRQLQAQKTKRKIYNSAIDLFNRHGFDNTTIEDISRKAGVSVGAFYHYYPSKSDIYHELFHKLDEYCETTVTPKLTEDDFYDNIILYFKHYAAYNSARGTDAVKQLFNTLNVLFLDKSRYMFKLLHDIIKKGEEKNQLTGEMTSDEIHEFLMVVARGVVYDWLVHDGDYDLETRMVSYITEMKHIFVAK